MTHYTCDRCGQSEKNFDRLAQVTLPTMVRGGDPGDYRWRAFDMCTECLLLLSHTVDVFMAPTVKASPVPASAATQSLGEAVL